MIYSNETDKSTQKCQIVNEKSEISKFFDEN